MTPQERAEKSAEAMWQGDTASRALGISLERVGPGSAVATMEVRSDHINGHGICHGGLIFTLADTAFAFACNSYNARVVAQTDQITFLSPGQPGEMLTAEAVEVSLNGRSGVYDVIVAAADGRKIALFRGLCRQITGQHFDE
jgi:acyl-CoA thioesterase